MKTGEPFSGVVRQRSQLGRAMQQVELAAAAPAARESWLTDLQTSLEHLEVAFTRHTLEVEAPGALLDQIVDRAPRLQRAVEGTKAENATISAAISDVLAMFSADAASENHDTLRDGVMALLIALSRHRQKGADLIYDAYDVDIGGY